MYCGIAFSALYHGGLVIAGEARLKVGGLIGGTRNSFKNLQRTKPMALQRDKVESQSPITMILHGVGGEDSDLSSRYKGFLLWEGIK